MDLIVNLAPTGMIPTKEISAHVPISPTEIVNDVIKCYKKGITSVHLHARDKNAVPTSQKEIYSKIIAGIREQAPDLVIVASCSGRHNNEFNKRSDVLNLEGDLKPDMASLTLGSLNFPQSASVNTPDMIKSLAEKMLDKGIKPELEIFDMGMINYAHYLIGKELLEPPYYFNILLGNVASAQLELSQAGMLINALPENSYWSLAGFGDAQLSANIIAITSGGGVRTGIEDNIWLDKDRTTIATNLDFINRIHTISALCERKIMNPKKFRNIFNIK